MVLAQDRKLALQNLVELSCVLIYIFQSSLLTQFLQPQIHRFMRAGGNYEEQEAKETRIG